MVSRADQPRALSVLVCPRSTPRSPCVAWRRSWFRFDVCGRTSEIAVVLIVIATFVVGVWLIYCAWLVFDAWWFARFLLSSWPFIMLGVGSVAAAAYRSSARYLRPVVVAAVIALAIFQLDKAITRDTFDTRDNRRRFRCRRPARAPHDRPQQRDCELRLQRIDSLLRRADDDDGTPRYRLGSRSM